MNDIWFNGLVALVSSIGGGVMGAMVNARWARTGERLADAATKAASTDSRRADAEAEAIAISGLERLVQALEIRLRRCEDRHDQRDKDDAERDALIASLQKKLESQGGK
jgi:hypothetical protein